MSSLAKIEHCSKRCSQKGRGQNKLAFQCRKTATAATTTTTRTANTSRQYDMHLEGTAIAYASGC
eukprot:4281243-Amphidinium_carterae.1